MSSKMKKVILSVQALTCHPIHVIFELSSIDGMHAWFRIRSFTVPSMTSYLPDSNALRLLHHEKRSVVRTNDSEMFTSRLKIPMNSPLCVPARLYLHTTLFPSTMISSNIIIISGNPFHRR